MNVRKWMQKLGGIAGTNEIMEHLQEDFDVTVEELRAWARRNDVILIGRAYAFTGDQVESFVDELRLRAGFGPDDEDEEEDEEDADEDEEDAADEDDADEDEGGDDEGGDDEGGDDEGGDDEDEDGDDEDGDDEDGDDEDEEYEE